MGIRGLKNRQLSTAQEVTAGKKIQQDAAKPRVRQGRTGIEDVWDKVHPSAAYKFVRILKKYLTSQMLQTDGAVRGEISWKLCEDQENSETTGIVKFQISHMLAAAIMGDTETLLSDHRKGRKLFCEEPLSDSVLDFSALDMMREDSNRDRSLMGCYIDTGTGVYMRVAEVIRQYRIWGILLWPGWEEETKVHHTLWKILEEEYEEADHNGKNEIWKVILDSIDSLYIQEYQKKAMDICMKIFDGIRIPVKESPFRQGEFPMVDAWARATVFMREEVFTKLCADRKAETGKKWEDEILSAAHIYMYQWGSLNDLVYIYYGRNNMTAYDLADIKKKWTGKDQETETWRNKIWPEDAVSRELEIMEQREYEAGRNGRKRTKYFAGHLQILEELVREANKEEIWKKYLFFLNSLWKWGTTGEIQEDFETELKQRIRDIAQMASWVKEEYLKFEKETMTTTEIQIADRLYPQKYVRQLQFYKEEISPVGELSLELADMKNFKSICYARRQPDTEQLCEYMSVAELLDENCFGDEVEFYEEGEYYDENEWHIEDEDYTEEDCGKNEFEDEDDFDPEEVFCDEEFYETDGENVYNEEEFKERNAAVKEIWKILDIQIADESCLHEYQKKILIECSEEDFLYARECGFFPAAVLEKAQEYAAEVRNLKVLLAINRLIEEQKAKREGDRKKE